MRDKLTVKQLFDKSFNQHCYIERIYMFGELRVMNIVISPLRDIYIVVFNDFTVAHLNSDISIIVMP